MRMDATRKKGRTAPNAEERLVGPLLKAWATQPRCTDAELVSRYGPNALDTRWISMAPRVGDRCKHWESFALRDGEFFAMLDEPLAVAKRSGLLPLYSACRLRSLDGSPLVARILSNVGELSYAIFDYDRGDAPLHSLAHRAAVLDLRAMAHRSPSDGITESKILRHKGPPGSDESKHELVAPTPEACLKHLTAEGHDPAILGGLTIIDPAKVERQKVRIKKTDNWETVEIVNTYIVVGQSRLIVSLSEPFRRRASERDHDFSDRWANGVLRPIAHQLGFAADPKCFDLTRPFYLPSSLLPSAVPKNEITAFIKGEPLDVNSSKMTSWREAYEEPRRQREAERAARAAERKAALVEKGIGQVASSRYALATLLADKCGDRLRNDRRDEKDGLLEAECPFDYLHTNAGDPRDTGFFVTNRGVARCHHGHGETHTAGDFIAQMLADGWFTPDELASYALPMQRTFSPRRKTDWTLIAHGIESV